MQIKIFHYNLGCPNNKRPLEQISEVLDIDICDLLSFGEHGKVYFNNSSNDSTNSNNSNSFLFAVGNENLEMAIQQLQLLLSHKDELLAQKDKIINGLEREIALLRKLNQD